MARRPDSSITFKAYNEDFNKAIREMNAESKTLNKQFKLVQEQLKDTGSESDKLASKLKHLEKAEQQAADKATLTRKQFEGVKKVFGENSEEARKMGDQLLNAEIAHQKLSNQVNESRRDLERYENNMRDLQKIFTTTGKDVDEFSDAIGPELARAIKNGTATSQQLEKALAAIGKEALDTKKDLDKLDIGDIDTGGLSRAQKGLRGIGDEARDAKVDTEKLKDSLKEVGSGLSLGGAGLAAGAGGIVQGMQELNMDLARLRTNAALSGRDIKVVEDAFKKVTTATGEADSAVETVSNLLVSGFSDQQLSGIIDQINGAAIRFSDTLKTEGIADGIQETFATGEAIGPFAELLERSGVDLEKFNKKLQAAQKAGEGTNYIMEVMAEQGFGKVYDKYRELNPEVEENAQANLELQKALADLGIVLTPLIVKVTDMVTRLTEWASENPQLAKTLTVVGSVLGTVGAAVTALTPVFLSLMGIFKKIIPFVSRGSKAFGIIRTVLTGLSGPVGIAIAIITSLGIAIFKNWDEVKAKTIEIWGSIKQYLTESWENIKILATVLWTSIKETASNAWNGIVEGAKVVWSGLTSFFITVWENIKQIFNNVLTSVTETVSLYFGNMEIGIRTVWEGIINFFTGIWTVIKNIFLGAILIVLDILTGNWEDAKRHTAEIWNNIKNALNKVWSGIKQIFIGTIGAIEGFLFTAWTDIKIYTTNTWNGIKNTTSTIWKNIRTFLINLLIGMKNTVSTTFATIKTSISNAWENVRKNTSTLVEKAKTAAVNGFENLRKGVQKKMEEAYKKVKGVWDDAIDYIEDVDLYDIGRDVINGLINGITSKATDLYTKARNIAENIRTTIAKALDVHSPSRVMIELGGFVGEGLAIGIDKMRKLVARSADQLAVAATPNIKPAATGMSSASKIGETLATTIQSQQQFNIDGGNIYMDSSKVGNIIWKPVQKQIARDKFREIRKPKRG